MQTNGHASDFTSRVREIALEHAGIGASAMAQLGDADSLYDAGMNSHASVNLMLALERDLDLEFPSRLLTRSVFASIASITAAIKQVLG